MLKVGKTPEEMKELKRLLQRPHDIRMRVRLLDLNHNYLKDLSDMFVDGAVSVDNTAEVSRALDLTLFDPFKKIHIDPDTAARSSIFIADMVSVVYVVRDPSSQRFYNLATNPSLETAITTWTSQASWTEARTAAADAYSGGFLFRTAPNTAIAGVTNWLLQHHTSTTRILANPGQLCGWRIRMRTKPGIGPREVQLRLRSYLGTSAGFTAGFSAQNAILTEDWQEIAVSGFLPSGADGFALFISPVAPFTQWLTTDYVDMDASQPWRTIDPGPNSYFDGAKANTDKWRYFWTGTAHASTSVKEAITAPVFEIPVFCGPIDDVDRDDVWIVIKGLGKESLNLQNSWRAKTFKKGELKTDVIREILRKYCGETKMNIPNLKAKLPNDVKLTREKSPWSVAVSIAQSMGMQLFYDARGYAVLRKRPRKPVFVFDLNFLTAKPKVAYDLSQTINAVQVVGKKPKKARKKIKYTAVAQRRHPLSPWRLGRGTAPRYLWEVIEDESIESKKEAKAVAKRRLERGLMGGVEVTFDGLVHPALQESDLCAIKTDDFSKKFPLNKFTVPLVAGVDSSYGYLRRLKPVGGARGVKRNRRRGGKGKKDNRDNQGANQ